MKPKYRALYAYCTVDQLGIMCVSFSLTAVRFGCGKSGIMTVLLRFRWRLDMLPKSAKIFASVGVSVHKFCRSTAVSSAYALTIADGSSMRMRSMRISAHIAYRRGDSGHPCLTPVDMLKPSICTPFVCMLHLLLW